MILPGHSAMLQYSFVAHPFIVGETYNDRKGDYVVESIKGNQIRFRYSAGGQHVADIDAKETLIKFSLSTEDIVTFTSV